MVYLNRIYTRGGDQGQTSLGDGARVAKTHLRVVAYGAVDELNATVGVARLADGLPKPLAPILRDMQNDLFDVGADLCVPQRQEDEPGSLRVTAAQVTRLEQAIDEFNVRLQPLTSFVLPGGSPAAAALHVCRTVCRRAEVEVVRLMDTESVNPEILKYLNRLSDLLFVMARVANDDGRGDVLWTPGRNR
ncbi:MAG: cob(I)yrinic acid a,c-diamide adenosyltransferase [Planctomyces sp.]|nr:cob(I)yrinic acid a,c-diamide adenosyltransferase [Planctomyces sp.]